MRQLARQRPRFGADRIHKLLIAREWQVNAKRVHRLWKQEQMQVIFYREGRAASLGWFLQLDQLALVSLLHLPGFVMHDNKQNEKKDEKF